MTKKKNKECDNCGKKAFYYCYLCGSSWYEKCAEDEGIYENDYCDCQAPSIERI